MKCVLPRQEFQEALAAAATLTSGRTPKPILGCVKLDARDDRVEFSATDGEAGLRLTAAAIAVERPGVVVAPADRLLGIVRELPDVEVSVEVDNRHLVVRGVGSEFRIFTHTPEDFPPVADFDDEPDMVIDGHVLKRMIGLTLYAAARETSRYAINGVLWEKTDKRLFIVATDGRRLARSGGTVQESGKADFEAIIPAKAMSVFDRVFTPVKDEDWRVEVKVLPNQALLRAGGRVLSTVLVEGHFPKYSDVIPKDNDKRARLGREELFGAVKRAALLTTEDSRAVKLSFEPNQLVITSQSPEQGDARVEMPISYEGEPMAIGFNPAFLNDALRATSMDDVFIELQDAIRPGIVCGEDKNDFLYVVMPVQLSG